MPPSLAASASMLLTLLVFPVLMKKKVYLQLVFVATACDLIATSWVSIGYPTTPFACTGQAMFTQFFLYAEWCWTYFIAHKLYCTLTFNGHNDAHDIPWWSLRVPSKGYSMPQMHFLVWSTDLFFLLIPYVTNTQYGSEDKWLGTSLCFYKEYNDAQKYWSEFWTVCEPTVRASYVQELTILCANICLAHRIVSSSTCVHQPTVRASTVTLTPLSSPPLSLLYTHNHSRTCT